MSHTKLKTNKVKLSDLENFYYLYNSISSIELSETEELTSTGDILILRRLLSNYQNYPVKEVENKIVSYLLTLKLRFPNIKSKFLPEVKIDQKLQVNTLEPLESNELKVDLTSDSEVTKKPIKKTTVKK